MCPSENICVDLKSGSLGERSIFANTLSQKALVLISRFWKSYWVNQVYEVSLPPVWMRPFPSWRIIRPDFEGASEGKQQFLYMHNVYIILFQRASYDKKQSVGNQFEFSIDIVI